MVKPVAFKAVRIISCLLGCSRSNQRFTIPCGCTIHSSRILSLLGLKSSRHITAEYIVDPIEAQFDHSSGLLCELGFFLSLVIVCLEDPKLALIRKVCFQLANNFGPGGSRKSSGPVWLKCLWIAFVIGHIWRYSLWFGVSILVRFGLRGWWLLGAFTWKLN